MVYFKIRIDGINEPVDVTIERISKDSYSEMLLRLPRFGVIAEKGCEYFNEENEIRLFGDFMKMLCYSLEKARIMATIEKRKDLTYNLILYSPRVISYTHNKIMNIFSANAIEIIPIPDPEEEIKFKNPKLLIHPDYQIQIMGDIFASHPREPYNDFEIDLPILGNTDDEFIRELQIEFVRFLYVGYAYNRSVSGFSGFRARNIKFNKIGEEKWKMDLGVYCIHDHEDKEYNLPNIFKEYCNMFKPLYTLRNTFVSGSPKFYSFEDYVTLLEGGICIFENEKFKNDSAHAKDIEEILDSLGIKDQVKIYHVPPQIIDMIDDRDSKLILFKDSDLPKKVAERLI